MRNHELVTDRRTLDHRKSLDQRKSANHRKLQVRVGACLALVIGVVGVAVIGTWRAPSAGAAASVPIADTYVDASRANSNFATAKSLRLDASPARRAYLKFTVSGVGPATSAQLRIYSTGQSTTGFSVYAVPDTTWAENTMTFNTAPPLGALVATSGPVAANTEYRLDVSSAVPGDGTYSFAVTTSSNTAFNIASRESTHPPELHVPTPLVVSPSPFQVTRSGSTYTVASQTSSSSYVGSDLASLITAAVSELGLYGGGDIVFTAGDFDMGSGRLDLNFVNDIRFLGAGIDVTYFRNSSSAATDTEPFDFGESDRITIRDMTVLAGGPARSTSDALDFDNGDDIVVERVKVTQSRGRGIVFDGKNGGSLTADRNILRDCIVDGVTSDGIELLGSNLNLVEGCVVSNVGGHGIQITKGSAVAVQPNKQSNDNVVRNNVITNAGQDGININSSSRNTVSNNTIYNSANLTANRDGIRIGAADGIVCNDNVVDANLATDNQAVKTQRYGLNISSSLCSTTIVANNDFSGNALGPINDLGTNTQISTPADTQAPTVPTSVVATAVSATQVDVSWGASTDNVAVDRYTVYRDGVPLITVPAASTSHTDSTVAPLTAYSYTVEAVDVAGNPSGQSSPAALVTTPDGGGGPPAVLTLTPVADSYVHETNLATNYGSSASLRVDGSPVLRTYLTFQVSGLAGAPTDVRLRIFASSGSSSGHSVLAVADTSWSESTITFANAPATGTTYAASGAFGSGTWVEVLLPAEAITGNGTYSFALVTANNTAISYASRESANDPQLVITV